MKSNQIDPPWIFLSAGLKPYRAGSDRIRRNVSHAEKSITVASGWLIAKAVKPRRNSSFQFPNRTPLSPILGPKRTQVLSFLRLKGFTHRSATYTTVGHQ
jgi:hypothetical protein